MTFQGHPVLCRLWLSFHIDRLDKQDKKHSGFSLYKYPLDILKISQTGFPEKFLNHNLCPLKLIVFVRPWKMDRCKLEKKVKQVQYHWRCHIKDTFSRWIVHSPAHELGVPLGWDDFAPVGSHADLGNLIQVSSWMSLVLAAQHVPVVDRLVVAGDEDKPARNSDGEADVGRGWP